MPTAGRALIRRPRAWGWELHLAGWRDDESDGATRLADEACIVDLAAETLWRACPGAVAVALTRRPGVAAYGPAAIWRDGRRLPCPPTALPRPRPGVDLDDVPMAQRDRWHEPEPAGFHAPEHMAPDDPRRRAIARLRGQAYGRVMVCQGRSMVAWIGAFAIDRPGFTAAERETLVGVAVRMVAPLRAAALLAASSPSRSATPRQQALIRCVARGMTNKEIARALAVSPGTVKTMLE